MTELASNLLRFEGFELDLASRELLARATLAHTESGSGVLPGRLPAALANIDMAEGKLDQADKHLQQALAAFRPQGDRRNEAMMLNNTGYLRGLQNLPHEAEPLHLQSLEIRREIGDTVGQGRILGMLSTIYENDGRLNEAREAATESYRIANEANDKLFMATGLAQLASVEQKAGNLDEARRLYVESTEIFELIEDYSRAAQVVIRFAYLDRDTGDYAAAYDSAQEVLVIALREALDEPAIEAMELSGDIARLQLDSELAIESYRSALHHIETTGFISRRTSIVIKLANTLSNFEKSGRKENRLPSIPEPASKMNLSPLPSSTRYEIDTAALVWLGMPVPSAVILISPAPSASVLGK
jgi:tetratricopeptide (TPR) repeat protein